MGIEVCWDNEAKTVIRYVYDGRWTWQDFENARVQAAELESTVDHRVNVIVDVLKSRLLPSGSITRARQVGTTNSASHPQEGGIVVIVGAGPLVRAIFDVLRKVYPEMIHKLGFHYARTLAEARGIVAEAAVQVITPE